MLKFIRQTACATLAAVSFTTVAIAGTVTDSYTSYWALGDSLSDNGNLNFLAYGVGTDWNYSNNIGTNTYYTGRFSNGPTWAEYVAQEFSDAGLATGNLAYGGGEALEPDSLFDFTPGLEYQRKALVDDYAGQFGSAPLVSLLMGANDIFEAIGSSDLIDIAQRAADAVTDAARFLSTHGVNDFLIGNLPDLGLTPAYSLLQPGLHDAAYDASVAFNARLAGNIAGLRDDGLNVVTLDIWSIMYDIIGAPADYGLSDTVHPCLYPDAASAAFFGDSQSCSDAESLTRLFFDSVHPSMRAHEATAQAALAALMPAPVPLPAGMPLLVGAVAGFAVIRRKRAA